MLPTKSNSLERAEGKIKQLKEALHVCESMAWNAHWAQDFAKFTCIQEGMERILETIGEVEDVFRRELDYVDNQISDYEYKLMDFEIENKFETD